MFNLYQKCAFLHVLTISERIDRNICSSHVYLPDVVVTHDVCHGKHLADPKQSFLLTDSKLQRLVNVNMKIRKCHPKMFCTYAGTNFLLRATEYRSKQQKTQEWP